MVPFSKSLERVVSALLQDLDTPRALTAQLLIKYGEWDQLVHLHADPAHYLTPGRYYLDCIATEFLRKCSDLPTTIDTAAVAREGFFTAEKSCCETNLRLSPFLNNGPFEDPSDLRIADFLRRVRGFCAKTLGRLPNDLEGRFGPGATFDDKSVWETVIPHKIQSRPTVTKPARCLLPLVGGSGWFRALCSELPDRSDPHNIRGNRFTTVSKDATKDRGICIEPSVNIFLQLAVGGVIRDRLRRVGIDLEEGQSVHKRVACDASNTGRFATIDLSSASDTVCRNLVKLLLPGEWHDLLATLRSPLTRLRHEGGGKPAWHYLEKFSSMGNGFTFELETLVFLSLAVETARELGVPSVVGRDIYVYGDDIIVPVEMADALISVLRWCGFATNRRKTYIRSAFKESCGGDYFLGSAVRPYYLKETPNDAASWISLANGIRRMASTDHRVGFDRVPIQRAWFRVLDNIPSDIRRCRGPVQLGDLLIHDSSEKWSCKTGGSKWGPQVRTFRIWKPVSEPIPLARYSPAVQLAAALYGVPSTGPICRDSVSGYRFGRVPLSVLEEGQQLFSVDVGGWLTGRLLLCKRMAVG